MILLQTRVACSIQGQDLPAHPSHNIQSRMEMMMNCWSWWGALWGPPPSLRGAPVPPTATQVTGPRRQGCPAAPTPLRKQHAQHKRLIVFWLNTVQVGAGRGGVLLLPLPPPKAAGPAITPSLAAVEVMMKVVPLRNTGRTRSCLKSRIMLQQMPPAEIATATPAARMVGPLMPTAEVHFRPGLPLCYLRCQHPLSGTLPRFGLPPTTVRGVPAAEGGRRLPQHRLVPM